MGLLFTSTNEPAQAMVLQVDAGLDQHNQAAAPLADVKPLATFAIPATFTRRVDSSMKKSTKKVL